MSAEEMNEDFVDIVAAFTQAGVVFVVVGAHALAAHGVVRATGDLDLFVRADPDNATRVVAALRAFGAPLESHGIGPTDFDSPGAVYQIGLPPRRIDILTELSGVSFDEAVRDAIQARIGGHVVRCIGREAMIRNKRATGRTKDLADAELLEALARDEGAG